MLFKNQSIFHSKRRRICTPAEAQKQKPLNFWSVSLSGFFFAGNNQVLTFEKQGLKGGSGSFLSESFSL
ncbi:hypothetical protein AAC387_Pa07g0947 [Persea americana]